MFMMNAEMQKAFSTLLTRAATLDGELKAIAESGISPEGGCFFIRKCREFDTNAKINDFPDKTGFECFINSVNVDDYVEGDYLEQGICLVRSVFAHWHEATRDQKLIAIVLMDELSLKVKFHLDRVGERWLADDLDEYEESILVVDSTEQDFAKDTIA